MNGWDIFSDQYFISLRQEAFHGKQIHPAIEKIIEFPTESFPCTSIPVNNQFFMKCTLLKASLFVLHLFLFSFAATAQIFTDVVHLKNGTVVRGIIIEQVPGKTIKVQTADALKIEINYSDIEKISKETSITNNETSIHTGSSTTTAIPATTQQTLLKKYFFTIGGGFFTGDAIGYTGRLSVGLRLGKHFDLQAFYQLTEADKALTRNATKERYSRLSLQNYGIKGSFVLSTTTSVRPYFSIGTGYSRSPFTSSGKAFTGPNGSEYGYYASYFINPSVGTSIPIGKDNSFFAEINYNRHIWTDVFKRVSNPKPYTSAEFASLLVGVKF